MSVGESISIDLTGSNAGTYNFKCVYIYNNSTRYFLCQTQLGKDTWSNACNKVWTAKITSDNNIIHTIENVTIATKEQLDLASQSNRAISDIANSYYWTRTEYSSAYAYAVNSSKGSFITSDNSTINLKTDSNGIVPLVILYL